MADTALVIMARYPRAGTTKTRLARAIGDEEAVLLYRAFLTDLAQKFAGQIADLYWAYTPAEVNYADFMATLVPSREQHIRCFPQQGADLGDRLLHAFQWTYKSGYERTIVIGSDSPHIRRDIVAAARNALAASMASKATVSAARPRISAARRPSFSSSSRAASRTADDHRTGTKPGPESLHSGDAV